MLLSFHFYVLSRFFLKDFVSKKRSYKIKFEGNNFLNNNYYLRKTLRFCYCFENQIRSNFKERILDGKIAQSQYCFVDKKKMCYFLEYKNAKKVCQKILICKLNANPVIFEMKNIIIKSSAFFQSD